MNLSKEQAQLIIHRWIPRVRNTDVPSFDDFLKWLQTWWKEVVDPGEPVAELSPRVVFIEVTNSHREVQG